MWLQNIAVLHAVAAAINMLYGLRATSCCVRVLQQANSLSSGVSVPLSHSRQQRPATGAVTVCVLAVRLHGQDVSSLGLHILLTPFMISCQLTSCRL